MTTYILLRDNKESAPCTLPDLKQLGLRPNDLIWVEGQSVCWMNPNQIKELKDLVLAGNIAAVNNISETADVNPGVDTTNQDSRHVFVSLPHTEQPVENFHHAYAEKPVDVEMEKKTLNEVVAETKYSKPLEEIKDLYLDNLKKKNQLLEKSWQIPPKVKRVAIFAGLFIAGLSAGLIINRMSDNKSPAIVNESSRTSAETSLADKQEEDQSLVDVNAGDNSAETETQIIVPEHQSSIENKLPKVQQQAKEPVVASNPVIEPVPQPEQILLTEEEKIKLTESEEKPVKKPSIKEIYSQVAVQNSDYTVGSFGGIKNLEVTVNNNSKYSLDQVEVQLKYFKPMDEFLRTETVVFSSIGAGKSKTIPIKKSNRGVKVTCKITKIQSSDFLESTAGL